MAAKVSDRTMVENLGILLEKLDPVFIVKRFLGTLTKRLYFSQRTSFIRNAGGAGLIVVKVMLRGVVKTASYWDFVGRGPFDVTEKESDYFNG